MQHTFTSADLMSYKGVGRVCGTCLHAVLLQIYEGSYWSPIHLCEPPCTFVKTFCTVLLCCGCLCPAARSSRLPALSGCGLGSQAHLLPRPGATPTAPCAHRATQQKQQQLKLQQLQAEAVTAAVQLAVLSTVQQGLAAMAAVLVAIGSCHPAKGTVDKGRGSKVGSSALGSSPKAAGTASPAVAVAAAGC